MKQLWALTWDTFRESRDSKLFWILLGISAFVAAALACVGFDDQGWSLVFGLYRIEDPVYRAGTHAVAEFYGAVISKFLIDLYLGWIGVALCLVATAGIFPAMLRPGAVELLLSKPISRWKLFFGKYVGSLGFVLMQSAFFVGLILLVVGVRAGVWLWTALWCIPLVVLLFSYLYSIAVLVAVRSRAALPSLLVTLLFWFGCFVVQSVYHALDKVSPHISSLRGSATEEAPSSVERVVRVAHAILPKTSDIALVASKLTEASHITEMMDAVRVMDRLGLTPEDRSAIDRAEEDAESFSIAYSLSSSLAFEAAVLVVAVWSFSRRDY